MTRTLKYLEGSPGRTELHHCFSQISQVQALALKSILHQVLGMSPPEQIFRAFCCSMAHCPTLSGCTRRPLPPQSLPQPHGPGPPLLAGHIPPANLPLSHQAFAYPFPSTPLFGKTLPILQSPAQMLPCYGNLQNPPQNLASTL